VIEAVYGLNQGLVDGTVEPDRWTLERKTGRVLAHQSAQRSFALVPSSEGTRRQELAPEQAARAPLAEEELGQVYRLAQSLEHNFGRPQDVEWTFVGGALYALQSRPITTAEDPDEQRRWYLTLTRSFENLQQLRSRVEDELIPQMEQVAAELGSVDLTNLSDSQLTDEIARREQIHQHWVDIYWADFIPLAHGARLFGQVYNDTMRPEDPYEFTALLAATPMQSLRRNSMLEDLAAMVRSDPGRAARLKRGESTDADAEFSQALDAFLKEFGNLPWHHSESPCEREPLVSLLLELADRGSASSPGRAETVEELQVRFLDSFSEDRRGLAEELLDLARASYQLRDDDNIHLGRIEAQLLAAQGEARRRLESGECANTDLAAASERAELRQELDHGADVPSEVDEERSDWTVRPRQLLGQPAGPGVATGPARVVVEPSDLFEFKRGEILVCDSIDPNMTLVVPLAAGVVERRGGMLIHGAIIAREYGLPCVTGVPEATTRIQTGDQLTVDGSLGLVVCQRSRPPR
jgi:pyruvate,water dikinase